MKKNDGGMAFPAWFTPTDHSPGMSLRDFFAAKVDVPWDVAEAIALIGGGSKKTADIAEVVAVLRYKIADAMLAERGGDDSK